jgi:hypothetical protein
VKEIALKRLREATDINNPKETKTKENKIRKNTILKSRRKSPLSYFKMKKKRGKINIGGNIYLQMKLKIFQPLRIRKFPHANPPNPNLPIQN